MGLLLYILLALNIFLFLISFLKIKNSKDKIHFTYFKTFLIGAWVWEDVLFLSIFHSLIVLITIVVRDIRVGLLAVSIFWGVRTLGEVMYFMLQQFIQPKFAPHDLHNHFALIRKFFGDISDQKCFILLQVLFQCMLALDLLFIALLLLNWGSIPASV